MTDRLLGLLLVLVVVALSVATVSSAVSCQQSARAREAVEVLGVGPGYPAAADFTVGTTPVLVNAADFGGIQVISISCKNPSTTACYWGHAAVDGDGASHCSSGCDTTASLCGDLRECYLECESEETIPCNVMLVQRLE